MYTHCAHTTVCLWFQSLHPERENDDVQRCDEKLCNSDLLYRVHTFTHARRDILLHTHAHMHSKYRKRDDDGKTAAPIQWYPSIRSRFCDICLTICWGRELSLARLWHCIHSRMLSNLNIHAFTRTHTDKCSCISFHVHFIRFTSYISADAHSPNYIRTPQYGCYLLFHSNAMRWDEVKCEKLHPATTHTHMITERRKKSIEFEHWFRKSF